jgi:sigma-B regulation protein RsbU (phosphoserine phosphatase)
MKASVDDTAAEQRSRRLAALSSLNQWGSAPEERFDRITRLARELFGVPDAEINFLDDAHQFTKSPQGPEGGTMTPVAESFCNTAIQSSDTLVVRDATRDDRFSSMDIVQGERSIRFYAGRPITIGDDSRVGTICITDTTPRDFSEEEEALLEQLGVWVERELREMLDRDRAVTVQRSTFPLNRVEQDEVGIAGLCMPKAGLSGDFYDWYDSDDDTLTVTLADVMGKGTGAALTAASIRSALRARSGLDPLDALEQVAEQLAAELDASESFATVFHARLDRRTGVLDYVDAGHGLSIVIRATGGIESISATGLPLGVASLIGRRRTSLRLAPGDALLSATDGLLDLFPDQTDPVAALTAFARPGSTAEETIDRIRTAVETGPASDDVTAVVVTRLA